METAAPYHVTPTPTAPDRTAWLARLRPGSIVGLAHGHRQALATVAALDENLLYVRYTWAGQVVDLAIGRVTGTNTAHACRIEPPDSRGA